MALVAAMGSINGAGSYCDYSPRMTKKKKIRVNLDDIPHHSWVLPTLGNRLGELQWQQWEEEVRRIRLSSLPTEKVTTRAQRLNASMGNINSIKLASDNKVMSDGCIACSSTAKIGSHFHHSDILRAGSPSLRKAVITRQACSVDSCVNRKVGRSLCSVDTGVSGSTDSIAENVRGVGCDRRHSHSDYCLREEKRHSHEAATCSNHHHHHHHHDTPSIDIVSSYSALKCGTNHKTWTVKVDIRPFLPKGEVMVSAEGQFVKIKAKYGDKHKGFVHHIFGSGQKEVKRTLKFAGVIEPSSLRTSNDKEGFLTIDLYEVMP